jgi:cytidylate kinase
VAQRVAAALGYHYLDSGAIYRATAVAAGVAGVPLAEPAAVEDAVAGIARLLDLRFEADRVFLGGADVTAAVRSEAGGQAASAIAALPSVRAALLQRQRDFRCAPGLVADGRDMASVVFPDAALKVFLTADVAERASRRSAQLIDREWPNGLIENENSATIRPPFEAVRAQVLADLTERDRRDSARPVAPLARAGDARLLDTTRMSIDDAVAAVLSMYRGGDA